MTKLRMALCAVAAWTVLGAVWLTVSPTDAQANHCSNGECSSAVSCTYSAGQTCNMGSNWCGSTACAQE